MMTLREIENEIKKILGIPKEFKLYSLILERVGKWEYYKVFAYDSKNRMKGFRVRRDDEPVVLELWKEFERLRREKKRISEMLEEVPIDVMEEVEEELEEELLDNKWKPVKRRKQDLRR